MAWGHQIKELIPKPKLPCWCVTSSGNLQLHFHQHGFESSTALSSLSILELTSYELLEDLTLN